MKKNYCKGISLIETLVAIGIMSLLVTAVASLFVQMSQSERRNRVIAEVESQAGFLMYQMAQSVRNGTAITLPVVGVNATSITIAEGSIPAENPTIFSITNQALFVKYGASAQAQLSNNLVDITSLTFQNLTAEKTKGTLRITMSVRFKNPLNDPRLDYTTTYITTVSER